MSEPQTTDRLLGAHMSTAGGLKNSLYTGKEIGCTAVQLFTSSPRQWTHPPLDPTAVSDFKKAKEETGIGFTVAHDSYLINLAAPDEVVLNKSIHAFQLELERAEELGIPWVVTHMGARLKSDESDAVNLLCDSLNRVLELTSGYSGGVALETTAGQGSTLGDTFEQIAKVLDGCNGNQRLGVCVDTCHIFVAGYDIRDEETYDATFQKFSELIGFDRMKVIHANDAKKPLGSRVDRHEHIGDGEIGIYAFNRLVNDPRMFHVPIIIETPELETMHAVNLNRLKELVQ